VISHRFGPVLRELQPLAERFAAAGHRLFLVGGTVRDILLAELGDDRADVDIADEFDIDATTTARPDEIKRCLNGWADSIWTLGERFGTIGATKRVPSDLPGAAPDDTIERIYEITTHRADAYHDHSRKPDVEFSTDINADLSRRDFTVNAMAIDVTAQLNLDDSAATGPTVVDPFGGLHDLRDRLLRTPLAPEASFSDDPLRMLRAARFIARYGLRPDAALVRAVRAMADRLQIVSAERIRDELHKLLAAPLPSDGLRFVADTGLMQHVVPELVVAPSQPDEPCHAHLWAHTIDLVDAVPASPPSPGPSPGSSQSFERRLVRMAALLRPLGADKARHRLRALRASNDETRDIVRLIQLHESLLHRFARDDAPWTDGDVRRHVRDAGPLLAGLHALLRAEAVVHGRAIAGLVSRQLDVLQAHVARLSAAESLDDLGPQIDGAAVMAALGLEPGPSIGRAIAYLTELRLDEGLLSGEDLHSRLEEWWFHHKA
jgi:poly(A) polymerase